MSERRLKRVLTSIGAALLLLFTLAPVAVMLLTSVSPGADLLASGGLLTLAHYRDVLGSSSLGFLASLGHSLLVASLSTLVAVLSALLAAHAVTRLQLPGRRFFLIAVLAVSMFPQISLIGHLYRMMAALGWLNSPGALVPTYAAWLTPLALWILVGCLDSIPRELDEAALIDGCSPLSALLRIVAPLAAPGLAVAGLLSFIAAYNEFLFALMLAGGERFRTVPVCLALFEGLHGEIPWGPIMAAATIAVLPVLALTLAFQRRLVQGLTRGAVKG